MSEENVEIASETRLRTFGRAIGTGTNRIELFREECPIQEESVEQRGGDPFR